MQLSERVRQLENTVSTSLLSSNNNQQTVPATLKFCDFEKLLYVERIAEINKYVAAQHAEWGRLYDSRWIAHRFTSWPNIVARLDRRPIRVGYISGDFKNHVTSYFMLSLFSGDVDKEQFHISCYYNAPPTDDDHITARFRSQSNAFHNIHRKPPEDVAKLIYSHKIDILIEINGHTANNCLSIMSCQPAPISINYLGYPNTTGMTSIKYRLTDEVADDVNTQQAYTEQVVRIPAPFLCYTPPYRIPDVDVQPLPFLRHRFITFGTFNRASKLNEIVIQAWCRILLRVPNSRLLIKDHTMDNEITRRNLQQRFTNYGVHPSRIVLIAWTKTTVEHLQKYSELDIGLDTFPYAGTTTTCDALYMGVPVVTFKLPYSIHCHNVGASIVSSVPVTANLVAHSLNEYMEIAVNLANDVARLQNIRKSLRESMLASPLCDTRRYTKNVEKLYKELWADYCSKQLTQTASHDVGLN